jgi:hypothetical protein
MRRIPDLRRIAPRHRRPHTSARITSGLDARPYIPGVGNQKSMTMRTLSAAVLFAILTGIAGQAYAATADEINPNNTKSFYDQMDREGRGGNANGG